MVLVDTSVWIDHLHRGEPRLVDELVDGRCGSHPFVIEELALGSMSRREDVIGLLEELESFPLASHEEVLALVGRNRLWGRGLSAVDAHLLAALRLRDGGRLWTRDKTLRAAARELGIDVMEA